MVTDDSYTHLAVAGAGLVGKRHIEAIMQSKQVKLSAIIDPRPEIEAYSKELNRTYYPSITEMFASQAIDGLVVATPNNLHLDNGLEAIRHGCPVLIEKPLATNSSEAETLVNEAKSAKVPLLVGHHRRHNPLIRSAYEQIQNGNIGDIRGVHAQCWFYKPDEYFDEAPWRKQKGAGPIIVNLVHDIDLLRYLCGEIVSVYAEASPASRGYDNEDIATIIVRFENNALCTISVADAIVSPWSWEFTANENAAYSSTDESCYLIGGTKGSLSIPDLRLWRHIDKQSWWEPLASTYLKYEKSSPLHQQIQHFVEVINNKTKPLVSGEEGLKNIYVLEAILKSVADKKTIFLKK